ncbi:malonyl-ACP O-methyltransferase BioC [Vibrio sp. MACH09]|uniref:malonyl-ACP O-methyltransferase BioC n=1 Tax=Vibrio sp. MACH09 TaxID=3025122 RepID=UPI00398C112F
MVSSNVSAPSHRKVAIADAFGKAAKKYDKHAEFQREVGERLMEKMPESLQGLKVLDIGCGTGYFSNRLADKGAKVVAADLSAEMLQQARCRCLNKVELYQVADAESLPFSDNQFDVVFSSLALQWCLDLSVPLKELQRVTKPGGKIYFSTLADGSLTELKQAWAKIDAYQHVNGFLTMKQINLALAQSGSVSHQLDLRSIQYWYSSALQLMKDLKGIGATYVSDRSVGLTKNTALKRVEKEYQAFSNSEKRLPATYQVCFGTIDL